MGVSWFFLNKRVLFRLAMLLQNSLLLLSLVSTSLALDSSCLPEWTMCQARGVKKVGGVECCSGLACMSREDQEDKENK